MNDSDCVDTAFVDLRCVFDLAQNARWLCGPVNCSG
jgi:hypothetical protein